MRHLACNWFTVKVRIMTILSDDYFCWILALIFSYCFLLFDELLNTKVYVLHVKSGYNISCSLLREILKGEFTYYHQYSWRFVAMRQEELITRSWACGSYITPSNDENRAWQRWLFYHVYMETVLFVAHFFYVFWRSYIGT